MKSIALLLLVALLGMSSSSPEDKCVLQATVSIALAPNHSIKLSYRTIAADSEIKTVVPGRRDNPEGRALYEQLMSQQMMKATLDLDGPIEIEGLRLEAGRYKLGLSGFGDGNYDLGFFRGREHHKLPVVMDPAHHEFPYIMFSLASCAPREVALILHAGKKSGLMRIKPAKEQKDEDA